MLFIGFDIRHDSYTPGRVTIPLVSYTSSIPGSTDPLAQESTSQYEDLHEFVPQNSRI